MAEELLTDFEAIPEFLRPSDVLLYLTHLTHSFEEMDDDQFLESLWQVMMRFMMPRIPTKFQQNASESKKKEAHQKQKMLMKIFTYGTDCLNKVAFRIAEKGMGFPGKEKIMNAKSQSVTKVLMKIAVELSTFESSSDEVRQITELLQATVEFLDLSFSVKSAFQEKPTLNDLSAPLWSKLNQISLDDLKSEADCSTCCVCPNTLENLNFVVLDKCSHSLCSSCAQRIFGALEPTKRRCPLCRTQVEAYTFGSNVARFKESSSLKCNVWKLLNSAKSSMARK